MALSFVLAAAFAPTTALRNSAQCSMYHGTPAFEAELQALYLKQTSC